MSGEKKNSHIRQFKGLESIIDYLWYNTIYKMRPWILVTKSIDGKDVKPQLEEMGFVFNETPLRIFGVDYFYTVRKAPRGWFREHPDKNWIEFFDEKDRLRLRQFFSSHAFDRRLTKAYIEIVDE